MERLVILAFSAVILTSLVQAEDKTGVTVLSTVLTPETKEKTLSRLGRSYYDPRLGPRPLYDRLEYARPDDRPARCGRCYDDDRDDYDRSNRDRDRYDDDRRSNHRPTYGGNRLDRNKNGYENEDDDRGDKRFNNDRGNSNKNGTEDENDTDGKKRPYDDKDDRDRPSGGRNRNRNRNDDRDRYRPDYYDRFLSRDPYRERPYERPYYDDPYRERRPLYDRYDDPYGAGSGYGGGAGGGYGGYRRPGYEDRYDRGNGYDDAYGGYGPGVGRGPHDSFRPWDETYRGQAGWDAGGRGYYFASGRPEAAPAPAAAWGRPEYSRPAASQSGWQNVGYAGGYRDYQDPLQYRGSVGYGQDGGYRQDVSAGYGQAGYGGGSYGGAGYAQGAAGGAGYGQGGAGGGYAQGSYGQGGGGYAQSGWHNVGERVRPYRDESGVNQLDNRDYRQSSRDRYPQAGNRQPAYGQSGQSYGQSGQSYGQPGQSYGQAAGQTTYQSTGSSSSTTPQTSYLYQRDDEQVTPKAEDTTKTS